MLNVEKIRFKNLLSFGNNFTEIDFSNSDSVLIKGQNGSGKSSAILDSLCFGFFGKPFRRINKPTLVNYKNKKNLIVEVWFSVNGKSYRILRGLSPALFEIYENGILLKQDAAIKDYQDHLEKNILKIDYNTFTQIAILGKATYIAFLRLKMDDRRKFIENILNLSIFSSMNEINKNRLSKKKIEMENIIHSFSLLKSEIQMSEKHFIDLEKQYKKQYENQKQLLMKQIEQLKNQIEKLENEKEEILKTKMPIDMDLQKVQQDIEKWQEMQYRISMKLSTIRNRIDFFTSNNKCPTCESDLNEEIRNLKIKKFNDKEKELEVGEQKILEKIDNISFLLKRIQNCEKHNREITSQISIIDVTIKNYLNQIKELEQRINEDKKSNNKELEIIESKRQELKSLYDKKEALKKTRMEIFKHLECHQFISTILKDNGIKSMIIKNYIPEIVSIMNTYLKELGLFVRFELNENFEETLYSRGINELNYQNFSEGEKLRIDLAMLLTWREICKKQNNMNINFLIFDEILDSSADIAGIENLLNIFKKMKKIGIKVMVVSHSDRWEEKFQETWEVIKQNGFSMIKHNT